MKPLNINLCPACIEKIRDAYDVKIMNHSGATEKCDHCRKKSYVVPCEVVKK